MKIKSILKPIFFIILTFILFFSLSGSCIAEIIANNNSNIDTTYDETLESINKILERNEQYNYVDSIIKNIRFDSYSYTMHIFGRENNDRQIMNARNKRIAEIEKKFGSL